LLRLLKETSRREIAGGRKNSIQMSGVSAYSSEFEIISQEIPLEKQQFRFSEQILNNMKSRLKELNPSSQGISSFHLFIKKTL